MFLSAASPRAIFDYTEAEWARLTEMEYQSALIRYDKVMDSLGWVERYIDRFAPDHIRVALNTDSASYDDYCTACWVVADWMVKNDITLYAEIPQRKQTLRRRKEAREAYRIYIQKGVPAKKAIARIAEYFGYDRKSVKKWVTSEEPPEEIVAPSSAPTKPLKRGVYVPHDEDKLNRFAWKLATRFASRHTAPKDELHSVAMVEGMAKATRYYDPGRGAAFETFAYKCMQGAVLDYVRKMLPKYINDELYPYPEVGWWERMTSIANTDVVEGVDGGASYSIPASGKGATSKGSGGDE